MLSFLFHLALFYEPRYNCLLAFNHFFYKVIYKVAPNFKGCWHVKHKIKAKKKIWIGSKELVWWWFLRWMLRLAMFIQFLHFLRCLLQSAPPLFDFEIIEIHVSVCFHQKQSKFTLLWKWKYWLQFKIFSFLFVIYYCGKMVCKKEKKKKIIMKTIHSTT